MVATLLIEASDSGSEIIGVADGDLGALLVGIGAVLLLIDVITGGAGFTAITWGGTRPMPRERFSSAAETVGSVLVAIGSGLLLFASTGLTVNAVLIAVGSTAAAVYLVMAKRLHDHVALAHKESNGPRRSWAWCLTHPLWTPPKT